ncbi:hypothetical protein NQ317_015384 [Molorchus minor]|uniref:Uncharacterized protein n=1 Tax=Molorchus minor TaxID=1323400 RepID=A0ABQ9IPL2_9CUCU|nr:hypothetical protein NQ317_015384 [Molorchus minor]
MIVEIKVNVGVTITGAWIFRNDLVVNTCVTITKHIYFSNGHPLINIVQGIILKKHTEGAEIKAMITAGVGAWKWPTKDNI